MLLLSLGQTQVQADYFSRVEHSLQLFSQGEMFKESAEQAAARLAAGGKLWAAGQPSFVSELTGRAGGMMMIRPLGDQVPGPNDVVLLAATAPLAQAQPWPTETEVIAFAPGSLPLDWAADLGIDQRYDANADCCQLPPSFSNIIPAWTLSAEIVGALTRLGKMPVMYETIGLPGGYGRIAQYNSGEIPFHEDLQVKAAAPGEPGGQFIAKVTAMLERVKREEMDDIKKAAQWAREAKAAGKTTYLLSMGHLYPMEVENTALGEFFKSGTWYSGFHTLPQTELSLQAGDFVLHLGYQHPPVELLELARKAGARVAYIDLYAHRDYTDPEQFIWIDPMWEWPDACVVLEGYDIPFIPPSGVVNTAIAWEIWRLAQN